MNENSWIEPQIENQHGVIETAEFNEQIIEGIYDAIECADEVDEIYEHGFSPGVNTGIASLHEYYNVKLGQWTVITGVPGSGKSTLLDTILVNISENYGWKHLVCSPENQPIARHIASLCSVRARNKFHSERLSKEAYISALEFIQDHFRFIKPPEDNFTPKYVLDLSKFVESEGFNFNGLVIDPWNEMEHRRPAAYSETEYISYALSKFRRYVRDYKKHLWLVGHPTKLRKMHKQNGTAQDTAYAQWPVANLYDIAGSAHFYNKTDNGLSVWRDANIHDGAAKVYIQKIRFRECGKIGEADIRHDWETGRIESA